MRQRRVVKKHDEDYIANETTLELQFDVMFDACMGKGGWQSKVGNMVVHWASGSQASNTIDND